MDDKNKSPKGSEPSVDKPPVKSAFAKTEKQPANKKVLVGVITAVVLAVLVAAAIVLYNVWYQNPNRVVLDTLSNLSKTTEANFDAKMAVKADNADVAISLKGGSADGQMSGDAEVNMKTSSKSGEVDIKLGADVITETKDDKSTVYFKVNDLDKVVDDLLEKSVDSNVEKYKKYGYPESSLQRMRESSLTQAHTKIDPIVKLVNNKWIKTSADKNESTSCYADAYAKLHDDKSIRKEVLNTYKEHPFMHVDKKLGSEKGSLGYQFSIDEEAADKFSESIKDTDFGKTIKECGKSSKYKSSTSSSSKSKDSDEKPVVEIWSNRWTHKLSKVSVTGSTTKRSGLAGTKKTTDIKMELNLSYGSVDKKDIPSDATDIEDLLKGKAGNLPVSSLLQ